MNIQTANKLLSYRKKHNLSQEALAEKLGVSRQAVSKWERAEASPDTDNIILLAKIYGITLDELLNDEAISEEDLKNVNDYDSEEYVHIGLNGVHVKDENSEVHVGWNGIHVNDRSSGHQEEVKVDRNGVFVNGEKFDKSQWLGNQYHDYSWKKFSQFPTFAIFVLIYMYMILFKGFNYHPAWIILLVSPVISSIINTIINRNVLCFNYPTLMTIIFLYLGFYYNSWHPAWMLFITIPIFYTLVNYINRLVGIDKKNNAYNYSYKEDKKEKE